MDVDVAKGHEQETHQRNAEYEDAGSGVADQWAYRERRNYYREQSAMSVRRGNADGSLCVVIPMAVCGWLAGRKKVFPHPAREKRRRVRATGKPGYRHRTKVQ